MSPHPFFEEGTCLALAWAGVTWVPAYLGTVESQYLHHAWMCSLSLVPCTYLHRYICTYIRTYVDTYLFCEHGYTAFEQAWKCEEGLLVLDCMFRSFTVTSSGGSGVRVEGVSVSQCLQPVSTYLQSGPVRPVCSMVDIGCVCRCTGYMLFVNH